MLDLALAFLSVTFLPWVLRHTRLAISTHSQAGQGFVWVQKNVPGLLFDGAISLLQILGKMMLASLPDRRLTSAAAWTCTNLSPNAAVLLVYFGQLAWQVQVLHPQGSYAALDSNGGSLARFQLLARASTAGSSNVDDEPGAPYRWTLPLNNTGRLSTHEELL